MRFLYTILFTAMIFLTASATIINIPEDYDTIQEGIDASTDGDTVLVQPGTYVEGINFNGHNIVLGSLFLTTGDTAYIEHTIIDGNSSGTVVTFENQEDNSARITGLTIRNGFAPIIGAGIRVDSISSPMINYNHISGNISMDMGGGIGCMANSDPEIRNNTLSQNVAEFGGAIYASHSDPTIRENLIIENTATWGYGGGIEIWRSNALIENNIIRNNMANYFGGGIYCRNYCRAVIKGNVIKGNIANSAGGGIHLFRNDRIEIVDNIIIENSAPGRGGGGLYFYQNTDVKVTGNIIQNNSSVHGAGIYIFMSRAGPYLSNNVFIDNEAAVNGGGIYCNQSNPELINNVFSSNLADSTGGGAFIMDESSPVLKNCIFWMDSSLISEEIFSDSSSSPIIEYSDVSGGWDGVGNIDANPLFRDPANGDYHIMSVGCGDPDDSPCIDVGDSSLLDSLIDCSWGLGAERSDMGAFAGGAVEQSDGRIINVPGEYSAIQDAIQASTSGDTVLVWPGVYSENINFRGQNILLGSLFIITNDTTYISSTTIDGRSLNTVVTFDSGEDSSAVLSGFTIKNGDAEYGGGGIYCNLSSPTISFNIIRDNVAIGGHWENLLSGGAVYLYQSDARIANNIIKDNVADIGCGIYSRNSYGKIISNIISDNIVTDEWAGGWWGGLTLFGGDPIVIGNLIMNNYGGFSGGGIWCGYSGALIYNNVICGNIADYEGGGVAIRGDFPYLINNVIYNNIADGFSGGPSRGGGLVIEYDAYPTLMNNVCWDNFSDIDPEIHVYEASAIITYSDIEGGWEGEGNIDVDPLFRNPAGGDFHLMSTACGDPHDSPCIDVGHPDIIDSLLDCSWGLGTILSDMGAYGGGDSATVDIIDQEPWIPDRFALLQNYPNPFNARTIIRYSLPAESDVTIEIYDILGRRVETLVSGHRPAGLHSVIWDAGELPSGIYLYRIDAGEYSQTRRCLLLK